jgi:hypothetical protein
MIVRLWDCDDVVVSVRLVLEGDGGRGGGRGRGQCVLGVVRLAASRQKTTAGIHCLNESTYAGLGAETPILYFTNKNASKVVTLWCKPLRG